MTEIVYDATPRSHVIDGAAIPRLILGDNGFLRRYGSALSIDEIADRMRYAIDRAAMGVGAGDRRVLSAARRLPAPWVMHHTDIAFLADGRRAHFGRCMATLHRRLLTECPDFLNSDPLMGAFVCDFASHRPYEASSVFGTNQAQMSRIAEVVSEHRPAMTSIGGDFLDALLALGALDAARDALETLLRACYDVGSTPVLTTYLAGIVEPDVLRALALDIPALMVPFNSRGIGMAPDRLTVLHRLETLSKPVIAMHVLGAGRMSPHEALAGVLANDCIAAAVVGASSRAHIDILADAAAHIFNRDRGDL